MANALDAWTYHIQFRQIATGVRRLTDADILLNWYITAVNPEQRWITLPKSEITIDFDIRWMLNADRKTRLRMFDEKFHETIEKIGRECFIGLDDYKYILPIQTVDGLVTFIGKVISPDNLDARMSNFAFYSLDEDPFFDAVANDAIREQNKKERVYEFSGAFMEHIIKLPAADTEKLKTIIKGMPTTSKKYVQQMAELLLYSKEIESLFKQLTHRAIQTESHDSIVIIIADLMSKIQSHSLTPDPDKLIPKLANVFSHLSIESDDDFQHFIKLLFSTEEILIAYSNPNSGIHKIAIEKKVSLESIENTSIGEKVIFLDIFISVVIMEEVVFQRIAALLHYIFVRAYGQFPIKIVMAAREKDRIKPFFCYFFENLRKIGAGKYNSALFILMLRHNSHMSAHYIADLAIHNANSIRTKVNLQEEADAHLRYQFMHEN